LQSLLLSRTEWPDHGSGLDSEANVTYNFLLRFPQEEPGLFPANLLLATRARDGLRLSALARLVLDTPELRDAYAALLSRIRLSGPLGSGKSILVTSTQPNEGKTTVASCLAIAASLSGQSVLLIDGDLRRPSLASAAGIANGVGLGEVLEGRAEIADTIYPVELFEDHRTAGGVSVIGAGGKSPEFLPGVDWARARTSFQLISKRFDLVLFDSPPILAANDTLLLAGIVDGILLVVGAGNADRHEVRRAKEQLEPIGTPLIGAVLNQFDPKIHGRANQPYLGYNLDSRR
jgi:protein-tyrosine kinase